MGSCGLVTIGVKDRGLTRDDVIEEVEGEIVDGIAFKDMAVLINGVSGSELTVDGSGCNSVLVPTVKGDDGEEGAFGDED